MSIERIQLDVPTTGGTVTIANAPSDILCIIDPAATLATLTINMPTAPFHGQHVRIATTQILTVVTHSAGASALVGGLTAMVLGGFAEYCWHNGASKWARIG